MTTVNDILTYLYALAPQSLKEDWDNVGLVVGHGDKNVTDVLIALDASMPVLEEARDLGCQLVVSHHPVIFGGLKQANDGSVTGSNVLFAAENHIACVNMHTNLDCADGGVNDILAARLGLKNTIVLPIYGKDHGYIRIGTVKQADLDSFAENVKTKLNCSGLRYAVGSGKVKRVAVGGGACGDEIPAVLAAGCDTFVTADLKYHQFCDAKSLGLNLIDAGHYQTEAPVCMYLLERLSEQFTEVHFSISEAQGDPICFCN